jgi:formylmethanofuran dehydrogenase subunit C
MTALRLLLRQSPPCVLDAAPLRPDRLAGLTRAEIERIELSGWNEHVAVGELFTVRGSAGDRMLLEGLDGNFLRVGAELGRGELIASGYGGDYLGEDLAGGRLTLDGDCGDFAACGMAGGTLEIRGHAGDFLASGRAGALAGMRGGRVLVRGDCGARAADRMRRGELLIEGAAGDYCAARLIAGSVVVLGRVGARPGYLMRRGSLIVTDPALQFLPTFNPNGRCDPLAIRLLLRSLVPCGALFETLARQAADFERWLGDHACGGQGEILLARPAE